MYFLGRKFKILEFFFKVLRLGRGIPLSMLTIPYHEHKNNFLNSSLGEKKKYRFYERKISNKHFPLKKEFR